ncbi:MAG: hypothetical protein KAT47_04110 [Candidatus Aegiribacteria sp.]|nr:hypothetical protein [Candidatus Aegiribacteria sp.]
MRHTQKTEDRSLSVLAAFAGGLLSVIIQAVVLRESLFGHHQAELTSGIVLASWIAGSGIGAAVGGRTSKHSLLWVTGMILLPALGFLQVAASRLEIIPTALSVLPAGFVGGVVFVQPFAFCRPGKVYALEALGAAAGGGIFVLLSPHLLAFEMLAVGILISAAGLLLCGRSVPGLIVTAVLLTGFLFGAPESLGTWLGGESFKEYDSVSIHSSPYGEVVTGTRSGQHAIFRSGLLEATWPSLESAEGVVTIPLIAVLPSLVLYIGSSPEEAGIISEWPTVDSVVTLVPDRTLCSVAEYPAGTIAGDGRRFLSVNDERWNLVIVSTGQPLTILSNRFFTREFFELLSDRLTEDGVAAIHLPGGINRLHPLEAELAKSILLSAESIFRWSRILPSSGLVLLAGNGLEPSFEGSVLAERMDSIGASGVFVNSGTLPFDLSQLRLSAVEEQLHAASARKNIDLHPEGFRIACELWDIRVGDDQKLNLAIPIAGLCLLVMIAASFLSGKVKPALALGMVGFIGLSVEVIALVAIQAVTGHSWVLVGAITGTFMAGGALGALGQEKGVFDNLRQLVILSGISSLFSVLILHLYDQGLLDGGLLSLLLFIGIMLCGVASGGAFPVAVTLLREGDTRRIGLLDLAEHGGSAAAALLMPLVLFPLLGAQVALLITTAAIIVTGTILRD